jgi:hypothetical protein
VQRLQDCTLLQPRVPDSVLDERAAQARVQAHSSSILSAWKACIVSSSSSTSSSTSTCCSGGLMMSGWHMTQHGVEAFKFDGLALAVTVLGPHVLI